MAKKMVPKGKTVKGCNYVADDEEYDKKSYKKASKGMKTAGMEKLLKKAEKQEGYSDKPRVKPVKKDKKIVHGQKKVY